MKNQDQRFSFKNIWLIAYPIILGSLAQDIITIVDTAFAGRIGEIALGSIALGGIFYLAIVMVGYGFGIGIQVLIARRFGEKDTEQVKKIWQHAFLTQLVIASLLFIILKLSSPYLIKSIVSSTVLYDHTISFLNIRLLGLFAAYTNIIFRAFFIGIGNTKIISYTTIVMACVNILFDYLLMFGKGPFPNIGIEGAAYASVLAEYVATTYFVIYTFKKEKLKTFHFKLFQQLSIKTVSNILKISIPTMLQNLISFGAWFIFFVMVEKMGTKELAVSNIIRSLYLILLLPIMGISSATNSLTSQALGSNNQFFIPIIIKRSIILSLIGMATILSAALIFPYKIISIFTSSPELINATLPVFYVITIASFFLAIGFIMFNAVTGTGNTITALGIEVTTISLYLIGVLLIVNDANLEIKHVWLMEVFYGSSLALLSLLYLKYGKWYNKKI